MPKSTSSVVGFDKVKELLEDVISGSADDVGPHGAFWRELTRDQFVQFSVFGQPLIVINASGQFEPDNSALVKSLEGRAPFGKDIGVPGARFRRMPAGKPPMSPENITSIRDWIAGGCKP